ncbi:MAG: putative O-glycosylation ligase, exosortase A system-associated [Nitrosomonadales bacterium]|nr:MAG: putative O-glycosylation ligase, exosortase A system-associated [Nitrosomonadales bacterium]
MRDILVTLIVVGSIPFILKRPYIGVLMWVWISVMNPHRLAYGFAVDLPFAAIVGGATLIGLVVSKDPKNLPLVPLSIVFIAFILWMNVTTLTAIHLDLVYEQWKKVMKIMFMILITLMLIKTKQQVQLLIGVIVFSLAFYGVKGGIFTILGGGQYIVWGPPDSFIAGNNEMALALTILIPLVHYFQLITKNMWMRYGLTVVIVLCAGASIASYSRGALLAIAVMGAFLWFKSHHKLRLALLFIIAIPIMVANMPEQWGLRMNTIETYQADTSVQGRFNAWEMAFNLTKDRPVLGGGFEVTTPELFARYAPNKTDIPRAAHSIYFQALGEHGYVGLSLYLLLGFLTWRTGTWIIRNTRGIDEYQWATSLATMIQVSLVGFAMGGTFLSLLYFDVPFYLMAALIVTRSIVEKELKEKIVLAISTVSADSSRQLGKSSIPLQPITRDSG